jgi:2-iminoacetate synthase ThiH
VLLHGAIKNLQVSWVKLGFDVSLDCLKAGANDFSGTLMEESISKAAGATFGEFVSPEQFQRLIRSIGRVPAERSTTYKIRRLFDSPQALDNSEQTAPEPTETRVSVPLPLPVVSAKNHSPYVDGAY